MATGDSDFQSKLGSGAFGGTGSGMMAAAGNPISVEIKLRSLDEFITNIKGVLAEWKVHDMDNFMETLKSSKMFENIAGKLATHDFTGSITITNFGESIGAQPSTPLGRKAEGIMISMSQKGGGH